VPSPAPSFRVGVLVSGEGSNLQALLDTVHGRRGVEIVAVGASRSDARGLERGRRAGVETASFAIADHDDRAARDRAMGDWLEEQRVDLVVLAGFMELLGPEFVGRFRGRMINVHPALLPAFPGVRAIERAFDHGVKVTGVTVHFVDEGIDSGPIILQEAFELPYSRGVAEIERGIHEIEHRLLPRAVSLIAEGRVRLDEHNPRLVRIEQPDGGTD
jgi:phosphoribosylglycinamide formyltransferase 1